MPSLQSLKIILPISFLFVLSLFTFHSSLIIAQTSALDLAQQDYSFQLTKYRDTEERYQVAKASYETFKTAVAKSDAYEKTKDHLFQIQNLYIAYLLLVKEHGNTFSFGQMATEKVKITASIDSEIDTLKNFQSRITDAKTLEDLPPLAKEIDLHIETVLEPKVNKTLATYELAQISSAFEDFLVLSDELDQLVSAKIQSNDRSSVLANWSSELQDIKDKVDQALTLGKADFATFGEQISEGQHDKIVNQTQGAKTHLKRSQSLFEEVARIL